VPHPKVKIADNSGNEVAVTDNALDVNIAGGTTIDIGDVDIHLSGNVPLLGNAGIVAAGVLRVTLANDDVHFGAVGALADADGGLHAQLMFANDRLQCIDTEITSADTNIGYLVSTIHTEDAQHSNADGGYMPLAVRNDTLAALSGLDGDYSPFQVNASGALYIDIADGGQLDTIIDTLETTLTAIETDVDTMAAWDATHDSVAPTHGIMSMGTSKTFDGGVFPGNVGDENDAVTLAASAFGVQYSMLVTDSGASTMCFTDNAIASTTPGLLTTGGVYRATPDTYGDNDACINQHDINGNLKTTHSIAGGGQGIKVTTGAGDHIVLGGDVACKKIDIQAQTDNTGLIAVGFNNVDVTEASGDGIILYAGDTYSLEVNNLDLIYIDSTVTGEGVRYTYFT